MLAAAAVLGGSGAWWAIASAAPRHTAASPAYLSGATSPGAKAKPSASASARPGAGHPAGLASHTTAAPRPAVSKTAKTAPVQVSGSQVTAIGDSILVASTPELQQALPGIAINAEVGRQFYTGLQVLSQLKAQGQLRKIVVFALGTNGTVTSSEISQLLATVGPDRKIVLVNTYEARSWEAEVNGILASTAQTRKNVVLDDWYDAIKNQTGLLWSDGIHPQPGGALLYARLFKAAVQKAANLP